MRKLLLLTLLPFFQAQKIPCTFHSCDVEQIQMNLKDEIQAIQLFNVEVDDYHALCQTLKQAHQIELDNEPLASHEEVYIFVDGTLLQKELLAQGYAHLKIANPTYLYGQEMIDASRHIRQTSNEVRATFQHEPAMIGLLYWGIVLGLWCICICFLKKA